MNATAGRRPRATAPLRPRGGRLSAQARATWVRQLATLTAVMPVSDAVATLARQGGSRAIREASARVHRSVQSGMPLAAALPDRSFPADLRATVAAGEASGRLPLLLNRLADSLEAQQALRARMLAALAYPIILLVVALGVVMAMLVFVVPSIAQQLVGAGQALPWLTRAVLALSAFVRAHGLTLVVVLLALAALVWLLWRRPGPRLVLEQALFRVPLVGRIVTDLEAVRWARLQATMLGAGLPLAEALSLVAPAMGSLGWADATRRMGQRLRQGGSLGASMAMLPRAPGLLVALAVSGEASGRLAPLLDSAAQTLDRQVSDRSRTLLSLMEPLIIVALGALVGVIILAVLLPILQLNQLAGQSFGGP